MAYLPYEDEEEQLAQGQAMQNTGTANYGTTVTSNPSSSNRFVNFGQYFGANNGMAKGNELVSGLQGAADSANTAATGAKTDVTTKAQSGTVQGPVQGAVIPGSQAPTPAAPRPAIPTNDPTFRARTTAKTGIMPAPPRTVTAAPVAPAAPPPPTVTAEEARTKSEQKYAGPSAADVDSLFSPLQTQANTAQRNIGMAGDASGVKALQGGTGFDATIASAGAGGRINQLQQKYGRLAGDTRTAHYDASRAATLGATTSDASRTAWSELVGKHDKDVADEAERRRLVREEGNKQVAAERDTFMTKRMPELARDLQTFMPAEAMREIIAGLSPAHFSRLNKMSISEASEFFRDRIGGLGKYWYPSHDSIPESGAR